MRKSKRLDRLEDIVNELGIPISSECGIDYIAPREAIELLMEHFKLEFKFAGKTIQKKN